MRFNFKTNPFVLLTSHCRPHFVYESFVLPMRKVRVFKGNVDTPKERHEVSRGIDIHTNLWSGYAKIESVCARKGRPSSEPSQDDRVVQVVQEVAHLVPVLPEVLA
jgi:hypothetical protein